MKTKILSFNLLIASLALSLLFSCQKNQVRDELQNTTTIDETIALKMANEEIRLLEEPLIIDATENEAFSILDDGHPENNSINSAIHPVHPSVQKARIIHCLDLLNLSQAQKDTIHHMFIRLHNCRSNHIQQVKIINANIIATANQHRLILLQKYNNNQITLQQLHHQLHNLKMQVKYQLHHNPQKLHHLQVIKNCNFKFFMRLQQVLTPTQWHQFKNCYI